MTSSLCVERLRSHPGCEQTYLSFRRAALRAHLHTWLSRHHVAHPLEQKERCRPDKGVQQIWHTPSWPDHSVSTHSLRIVSDVETILSFRFSCSLVLPYRQALLGENGPDDGVAADLHRLAGEADFRVFKEAAATGKRLRSLPLSLV